MSPDIALGIFKRYGPSCLPVQHCGQKTRAPELVIDMAHAFLIDTHGIDGTTSRGCYCRGKVVRVRGDHLRAFSLDPTKVLTRRRRTPCPRWTQFSRKDR